MSIVVDIGSVYPFALIFPSKSKVYDEPKELFVKTNFKELLPSSFITISLVVLFKSTLFTRDKL